MLVSEGRKTTHRVVDGGGQEKQGWRPVYRWSSAFARPKEEKSLSV